MFRAGAAGKSPFARRASCARIIVMMKAATHIAPAAWMIAAETRAVTDILSPRGAEAQALFVGGCVRNLMLAQEPGDIDIATRHQPDAVIALLNAAGIRTVPTGIAHGTVTALSGGKSFEITTLRRDVRTDGRHAEVAFTDDWQEDAARRDFTINTLLADRSVLEGGAAPVLGGFFQGGRGDQGPDHHRSHRPSERGAGVAFLSEGCERYSRP